MIVEKFDCVQKTHAPFNTPRSLRFNLTNLGMRAFKVTTQVGIHHAISYFMCTFKKRFSLL